MNSLPSAKYKQTSNKIEKNSLNSKTFLRLKKIREEIDKKNLTRKFKREKN